jgi:O-antigen ligase
VVGIVLVAAILWSPEIGLYVLLALFLGQGSPLYARYGSFAGSYTASDLVALLVLAGYVLQLLRHRTGELRGLRGRRGTLLLVVAAYFGWSVLASAWSIAPSSVLSQTDRLSVEAVVLFALALLLLDTPWKARRAAGVVAATCLALSLYTILNFQSNGGFASTSSALGNAVYRGGELGAYDKNGLAIVLTFGPAFAFLACQALSRRLQLAVLALTVPVAGLALLILTSRTTFIAIGLAVVVSLVLTRGSRPRVAVALIVALGLGTLIVVNATGNTPYYVQDRLAQANYDNFGNRLPGWKVGLQLYSDHPVAGVGTAGFVTLIPRYHVSLIGVTAPHSDYIGTLADGGTIGFVLLLLMLLALGRAIVLGTQRNVASIAIFVLLIVSMAATSIVSSHWVWVVLSVAAALGLSGIPSEAPRRDVIERTLAPAGVVVAGR